MTHDDIIEKLEEYLNGGMYLYVEPPLGKEECELFLKLLKENSKENSKEKIYKDAFNMLISELGLDYYEDTDGIKVKYIRDAMVCLVKECD